MEKEKDLMPDEQAEDSTVLAASGDVIDDEDMSLIIILKKPYVFERQTYTEIDLTGLGDLTAADMISVNNYISRTSGKMLDVMPEVSMEYACVLASKATKKPIEFFMQLPPGAAMKVKNRVLGFLFGSE